MITEAQTSEAPHAACANDPSSSPLFDHLNSSGTIAVQYSLAIDSHDFVENVVGNYRNT
jgi:hypothetical protein